MCKTYELLDSFRLKPGAAASKITLLVCRSVTVVIAVEARSTWSLCASSANTVVLATVTIIRTFQHVITDSGATALRGQTQSCSGASRDFYSTQSRSRASVA